jgi:hypothetical protein
MTKRFATVLLALGLGLTSLPTASWAAPISFDGGANVRRATSPSNSVDLGSLLLDYFAYVADTLTYYQDATANEAYLSTACDPTC